MLITAKILIAYNTDIARTCTCRPNNGWIPGRYLSIEKYDFQLTLVVPGNKIMMLRGTCSSANRQLIRGIQAQVSACLRQ